MKLGVHLPLMEFRGEGHSRQRLMDAVDAARDCGLAAVSANDHFVFTTPWLDGPTALAAVIERSGDMTLATTISLAAVRGPVPLAKTLAALDLLCEGRLIAGVGPGHRIATTRRPESRSTSGGSASTNRSRSCGRCCTANHRRRGGISPCRIARWRPVRIGTRCRSGSGSWGSDPGLARVARTCRRVARLRLQHDAGAIRDRQGVIGGEASRAGRGAGRVSQHAGHDVDVGDRRSRGRRTRGEDRTSWLPCSRRDAEEPARPPVHRLGRALRGDTLIGVRSGRDAIGYSCGRSATNQPDRARREPGAAADRGLTHAVTDSRSSGPGGPAAASAGLGPGSTRQAARAGAGWRGVAGAGAPMSRRGAPRRRESRPSPSGAGAPRGRR